jgi:L-ascorbate metabolism protein UlaG (beta-lactamase superfamily)
LLDYGDVKILTDPWFSEKPGYYRGEALGMTTRQLPDLPAVVVSHAHYDHYDVETFSE